jgi:hypothetical protein
MNPLLVSSINDQYRHLMNESELKNIRLICHKMGWLEEETAFFNSSHAFEQEGLSYTWAQLLQ